jgi:zinc D-Ala-D-Ala dipeptidase
MSSLAAKTGIDPHVMDLRSIRLLPEKAPVQIAEVSETDGFFINRKRSDDFRLRASVYDMLKKAQAALPEGYRFMIFETYRPFAKQETLWKNTNRQMKERYPDLDDESLFRICENFTANPYDGIGSGHMCAAAIDLTLCDPSGKEFDMGTAMHEKSEKTKTETPLLSDEERKLRDILKTALEDAGFINYPAEWWHYSYGDHQWAWLTGRKEAIYGILDI